MLHLNIHPDGDSPPFYTYDQVFRREQHWDQLESFEVRCFGVTAKQLVYLTTQQMLNLRRLKINDISLLGGRWECVFQALEERKPRLILQFSTDYEDNGYLNLYDPDGYLFIDDNDKRLCEDLIDYLANGGRHPCLPKDEHDSAASRIFRLED